MALWTGPPEGEEEEVAGSVALCRHSQLSSAYLTYQSQSVIAVSPSLPPPKKKPNLFREI